jgi:hypothetical protein
MVENILLSINPRWRMWKEILSFLKIKFISGKYCSSIHTLHLGSAVQQLCLVSWLSIDERSKHNMNHYVTATSKSYTRTPIKTTKK